MHVCVAAVQQVHGDCLDLCCHGLLFKEIISKHKNTLKRNSFFFLNFLFGMGVQLQTTS